MTGIDMLTDEVKEMVRDAIKLSNEIEKLMDNKELFVILMALSKVSGVMLAEAKGMSPDLVDETTSINWFSLAAAAAYRGHMSEIGGHDGVVH